MINNSTPPVDNTHHNVNQEPILSGDTSEGTQAEGNYSEIAEKHQATIQSIEDNPEGVSSASQHRQIDELETILSNKEGGLSEEDAALIDHLRAGVDVFKDAPTEERASLSILLQIMLLGAELNQEFRETNRQISVAETENVLSIIQSAVEELKDGATKKFAFAMTGAVMGTLAGVGGLGTAAFGKNSSQLGQMISQTGSSAGGGANAAGEMVGTKSNGTHQDILADSEKAKFHRDQSNEFGSSAQSNADRWLQVLGQAIEAHRGANSKTASIS